VTVAVLLNDPWSRSACVTVYVAAHLSEAPGASVVPGQVTADSPGIGSFTTTSLSVTLLVLVTVKVNGTCWPTALIAVVLVALTRLRPPVTVAGTVALEGFELTGAGFGSVGVPGGVPCAVAVSVTLPLFKSAWVTVYVAVHVSLAPAANVLDGQETPDIEAATDGALCTSVTLTLIMATLLVLVTVNVNGTCWPTALIAVVLVALTRPRPPVTVAGTVTVERFEFTGVVVPAGVPCAVAVSVTLPLSKSAWATV